jgi:hypothetical protein
VAVDIRKFIRRPKGKEMVFPWSSRNKDKNTSDNPKPEDNAQPNDMRDSVKLEIEQEIGKIFDDEIKNASQELVEEQIKLIKQTVDECKGIIRDLTEQEKASIPAIKEDIRNSIIRLMR